MEIVYAGNDLIWNCFFNLSTKVLWCRLTWASQESSWSIVIPRHFDALTTAIIHWPFISILGSGPMNRCLEMMMTSHICQGEWLQSYEKNSFRFPVYSFVGLLLLCPWYRHNREAWNHQQIGQGCNPDFPAYHWHIQKSREDQALSLVFHRILLLVL